MAEIDWLAKEALEALTENPSLTEGWFSAKRHELAGLDRLKVLRWLCNELDAGNKRRVCARLEISVSDLEAVQRVLTKI